MFFKRASFPRCPKIVTFCILGVFDAAFYPDKQHWNPFDLSVVGMGRAKAEQKQPWNAILGNNGRCVMNSAFELVHAICGNLHELLSAGPLF